MKPAFLLILGLSLTCTLLLADDDELDDESISKWESCAVAAGRTIQAGLATDSLTLTEKGKAITKANLPEDFNDAKAMIECKPGVVKVWTQGAFSCFSTILTFSFTANKLSLQSKKNEDPCDDSLQKAQAMLKRGDARAAADEAEGILYPDHYIGPDFEEAMLEVGRKQANGLYQKGDKAKAGEVAEKVSSWAQSAFGRCAGQSDTGRSCTLKKDVAIAAYNDLGFFIDESGKHAAAEGMLKEVLLADGKRAVAWLNLADAQWALKKEKEAKESYRKYRELIPEAKWPARVKERK